MHINDLIALLVPLVLEIWLLALLLKRNLRHRFPFFFVYVFLAVPSTAARLLTSPHYAHYFYVYWTTEVVLMVFSLAALHEVFHWTFSGFYRFWWFRLFYYGTIPVILGIAIRNAIVNPPAQAHPVIGLILDIGIAVNFVRVVIVSLFYIFRKLLGLEFRRYAYGIIAGFAIFSIG